MTRPDGRGIVPRGLLSSNRRLLVNVAGTVAAKGGVGVLQLLILPVYMRLFPDQAILGLWFTVVSLISYVMNFDLGIGNGLRNRLTQALAVRDEDAVRRYISSAYLALGAVTVLIATIALSVSRVLPWNSFLRVSEQAVPSQILVRTVMITLAGVCLNFLVKLITSVLYALQVAAVNNTLAFLQSGLLLAYLVTAYVSGAHPTLMTLAVANAICVNLPHAVATVVVFATVLKTSRPGLKWFSLEHARQVVTLGLSFFALQLLGFALVFNELFITVFFRASEVVSFQAYYRVFSLVVVIVSVAFTPLWSAVTRAQALADWSWIGKLYKILLLVSAVASALLFAVVPLSGSLISAWLGARLPPVDVHVVIAMALMSGAMVFYNMNTTITYGLALLKPQFVTMSIALVAKYPVTALLARMIGDWSAVPLANVIILIPNLVLVSWSVRRYLRAHQQFTDTKDPSTGTRSV